MSQLIFRRSFLRRQLNPGDLIINQTVLRTATSAALCYESRVINKNIAMINRQAGTRIDGNRRGTENERKTLNSITSIISTLDVSLREKWFFTQIQFVAWFIWQKHGCREEILVMWKLQRHLLLMFKSELSWICGLSCEVALEYVLKELQTKCLTGGSNPKFWEMLLHCIF